MNYDIITFGPNTCFTNDVWCEKILAWLPECVVNAVFFLGLRVKCGVERDSSDILWVMTYAIRNDEIYFIKGVDFFRDCLPSEYVKLSTREDLIFVNNSLLHKAFLNDQPNND